VECTLAAGLAGRIALVFGTLGNTLAAISAIQRDINGLAVVVAIMVVVTIAVVVSGVVTVIMVVSLMIAVAVVMTAMVLFAGVGDRAAIGACATPTGNTDDGKSGEHVHPVLHSSILRQLIW
jgi:hypothetical protein